MVNAKHIKFVPGHKTDVKNAQWIAELLQHGLLKASLIPLQPQRDLRELVRYRTRLIEERAREINRVHKVLEDAKLKLGAVATDIMGVSARDMLKALSMVRTTQPHLLNWPGVGCALKFPNLNKPLPGAFETVIASSHAPFDGRSTSILTLKLPYFIGSTAFMIL